jgi:hypothetical protein
LVDITEEAWFENERQGSLNQEDFDTIQRQLFGQKSSYLYERMMNSPKKDRTKEKETPNHEDGTPSFSGVSKLSFDSPVTGKREERDGGPTTSMSDLSAFSPMNSAQKSQLERSGSFGDSGNFKMLKRGFSLDMPFELEMEDPPSSSDNPNSHTNHTHSSKGDDSSSKIITQIPSFPSSHQHQGDDSELKERKSSLEREKEKRSHQSTPVSIPSVKAGKRDRTESYHSKASDASSQRRRSFLDESLLGDDDEEDGDIDKYGEDALIADLQRRADDETDRGEGTEGEEAVDGHEEEETDSYEIGEDAEEEEEEDEYSLAVSEAIEIPLERTPRKGGSNNKLKKSSVSRVAADLLLFQHQSPGSLLVNTPPRRERHSSSYLIQAGLLQEGTGTTPIKANNILSSTSPTLHHQLTHHPQTIEQGESVRRCLFVFLSLSFSYLLSFVSTETDPNSSLTFASSSYNKSNVRERSVQQSRAFSSELTSQLTEQLKQDLANCQDEEQLGEEVKQYENPEDLIDPRVSYWLLLVCLAHSVLPSVSFFFASCIF